MDINIDNKVDLVCTSVNNNAVYLYHGLGNGSFSLAQGFPKTAGGLPYHVSRGQFNADNYPDIAIANGLGNNIFIFYGASSGTFSAAPNLVLPVGNKPRTMCVQDFNADGFSDIAVVTASGKSVEVLSGYSAGTFAAVMGSKVTPGNLLYQAVAEDTTQVTIDELLMVSEPAGNKSRLFPNPADDSVNIRIPDNFMNACVFVFNGHGTLVREALMEGTEMTMPTENSPAGIYELRILDGERNAFQTRFIVRH